MSKTSEPVITAVLTINLVLAALFVSLVTATGNMITFVLAILFAVGALASALIRHSIVSKAANEDTDGG